MGSYGATTGPISTHIVRAQDVGGSGVTYASPPVFVTSSFAQGSAETSQVVNAPTTITTGNMLVAFCYAENVGTWSSTGWTNKGNGGATLSCSVLTKVATGSEPSTYTFTFSGAATTCSVAVANYSGSPNPTVDGTPAVDAAVQHVINPSAQSVTPSQGGDVWLVWLGNEAAGTVTTPPATMTNRITAGSNGVSRIYLYDKALATASPTGTAAFTLSVSDFNLTCSMLLT